jgi:hypothetical protein
MVAQAIQDQTSSADRILCEPKVVLIDALGAPHHPKEVAGGAMVLVLGEIAVDAPLLDHRISARHGPATAPRRETAPEEQREKQSKRTGEHEDDPDGVDVEPRGADVHGKGQNRADDQQEDADSDTHRFSLLHDGSTAIMLTAMLVGRKL